MSDRDVDRPWAQIALDKDRAAEAEAAMRRLNDESHEDPEGDPRALPHRPERSGWRGLVDRVIGRR